MSALCDLTGDMPEVHGAFPVQDIPSIIAVACTSSKLDTVITK